MSLSWFTHPDTELPSYPWELNMKRWEDLAQHRETYAAKRLQMIADGWTFAHNMDTLWDGDAEIAVSGPEHTPNAWGPYWDPGTWTFPMPAEGWQLLRELCWLALESGVSLDRDEDGWKLGISNPLIALNTSAVFYVGLFCRHLWVMHQLKCAMCAEMMFCLDHRGRPALHA